MKNIKNYEFFTNLAYEFGFNVVGITQAQTTNLNQKGLDEFIRKKYHGSPGNQSNRQTGKKKRFRITFR